MGYSKVFVYSVTCKQIDPCFSLFDTWQDWLRNLQFKMEMQALSSKITRISRYYQQNKKLSMGPVCLHKSYGHEVGPEKWIE